MSNKNYNELIQELVFIGGADDIKNVLKNENVDVILDLRAEVQEVEYDRLHSPIQDESIQKSIKHVVNAYNEGKKSIFSVVVEAGVQELMPWKHYCHLE